MTIRWKLLILLLAMSLAPLVVVTISNNRRMRATSGELAGDVRAALIDDAKRELGGLAEQYAQLLKSDLKGLQQAVYRQAGEVERRLADPPPSSPRVYYDDEYDKGVNLPAGLRPSDIHFMPPVDSKPVPMQVTYEDQVIRLAPGVDKAATAVDAARLSTMPAVYRSVRELAPGSLFWQYTALESGVHSSYPGHGGYPPEYDARKRPWYVEAKQYDRPSWFAPTPDASTLTITVSLATPVHGPDGKIAGVTGFDIPLTGLVERVTLPPEWAGYARNMVIAFMQEIPPGGGEVSVAPKILAVQRYEGSAQHWETPIRMDTLTADDPAAVNQIIEDVKAGRSGVRSVNQGGVESLWAYSPIGGQATPPFVLIMVPTERINARAVAAQERVLARTDEQLRLTLWVAAGLVAVVVMVALAGSRLVTRPVRKLHEASRRVAEGDLTARVSIRTGDELQKLGEAFNAMVPNLEDRMKMRQSLSVAMDVQQALLPAGPPKVAGLDVAGHSIYCDQTGGDYYDFIQIDRLGPHKLTVAVGDVTGHGIAAALLMTTARALLRSRMAMPGSLADIVTHMNQHLTADRLSGRFMTLYCMLIDTRERRMSYVSAGHDPAIVYDATDDSFTELAGSDMPLGVDAGITFTEHQSSHWKAGQIMLIGTDGIWETKDAAGRMFGKEALRMVLRENSERSAEEIGQAVTRAVAGHRGKLPQADDVTLVVIKIV